MQLKERCSLRNALTTATYGLLGIMPGVALASSDATKADTALFYYKENNKRIDVTATTANIVIPIASEETVTIMPTMDVITGASPIGATPTDKTQTFGNTTIAPGQLPIQSMTDKRYAISLKWAFPVNRLTRTVAGANYSIEKDYASLGANYNRMWDTENKLTTLTLGVSASADTVTPSTGVIYNGLSSVYGPNSTNNTIAKAVHIEDDKPLIISTPNVATVTGASGTVTGVTGSTGSSSASVNDTAELPSRSKTVMDALIGITRVLNRRTLMQINYSIGSTSGYLTDPYKIISEVDTSGNTTGYLTEKRPTTRLRQTLYWETVLHLPSDVVHLSYRRYWDSWQIASNTFELNYHFKVWHGSYFEPLARYYTQSAAYFYHHSLIDGATLPAYASADSRLAEMQSMTYGLKFGIPLGDSGEVSVMAMRMKQTGNSYPSDAVGIQKSFNLYPGLVANTIQVILSFTL